MKRLALFLAAVFVLSLLLGYTAANAQTYPPSETTPPPTTPVCVDCDDLPQTGNGAIGWGAFAAIGLLAIGGTATIIARKRYGRDDA